MAVDWTQLPQELLKSIADSIKIYADYIHFRAVCHSWRSSVPNTPRQLPPQLPWLMLPHVQSHLSHCAFFDLSDGKLHHLELPEDDRHLKRLCGSSHGWLVLLDESLEILLFNPLTRARLHLPPFDALPNAYHAVWELDEQQVWSSELLEDYMLTMRRTLHSSLKKVVLSAGPLSSNNFIAIAIFHHLNILAYCKKGDQSWTLIYRTTRSSKQDVIYYNDLFYAVGEEGDITVCDVNGALPMVSVIIPPLWMQDDDKFLVGNKFLVNSGDEELLLVTFVDELVERLLFTMDRCEVFRMNWSEQQWESVTSLGDRMLFIGANSSVSLLASDFRGCLGNSIYFTDHWDYNHDCRFGYSDVCIFKLSDGSMEPLPFCHRNPDPNSQRGWTPIWISPNPCLNI